MQQEILHGTCLPLMIFSRPFSGLIPGCSPETALLGLIDEYGSLLLTHTWLPLSYLLT